MRKQEKWIIAFALIMISIGIISLAISRDLLVKVNDDGNTTSYEVRTTTAVPIGFGTSVTRFFDEGALLSVWYAWGKAPSYVLDSFSYSFKIIAPQGGESLFEFLLAATTNPEDPAAGAIVYPLDLEIQNLDGLILDNSSRKYDFDFVAKTLSSGYYTLVYLSNYTEGAPVPRMTRIALGEITYSSEYPYASVLPFGVGFVVTGTIVASWTFVINSHSSRQSKRNR